MEVESEIMDERFDLGFDELLDFRSRVKRRMARALGLFFCLGSSGCGASFLTRVILLFVLPGSLDASTFIVREVAHFVSMFAPTVSNTL